MTAPVHPVWCDQARCVDGRHESTPARIQLDRHRATSPPRLMTFLWAPATGTPVKVRLVLIDDPIVSSVDLTLDEAHLAANTITKMLALAAPAD